MSRTYVIADVHGRFDLLSGAWGEISRHAAGRGGKIIVLGDFVDRGPSSCEVIGTLMACQSSKATWNEGLEWTVLKGNHEAMMVECCFDRGQLSWWIGNGGANTLMSYGYVNGDELRPFKDPLAKHLNWLRQLPTAYEDEHRIYVHAGLPDDRSLAETSDEIRQWMLYQGATAWRGATIFPDAPHPSGKHVVHGHEQSADHPLLKPHRTNLDSWAYRTGRLAIGVFDDAAPGGPVEILWVEEGGRGRA